MNEAPACEQSVIAKIYLQCSGFFKGCQPSRMDLAHFYTVTIEVTNDIYNFLIISSDGPSLQI